MNRRKFIESIGFVSAAVALAPVFVMAGDEKEKRLTYSDIVELEKRIKEDKESFEVITYKGVSVKVEIEDYVDERDIRCFRAVADTRHGYWCLYGEVSDMFYRGYSQVYEYCAYSCYKSFIYQNKDLEWK